MRPVSAREKVTLSALLKTLHLRICNDSECGRVRAYGCVSLNVYMVVLNRCDELEVDMSDVSAICQGCDLKVKDWPGLFCSTKSHECASAREYYYCMQQHGCSNSSDTLTQVRACVHVHVFACYILDQNFGPYPTLATRLGNSRSAVPCSATCVSAAAAALGSATPP